MTKIIKGSTGDITISWGYADGDTSKFNTSDVTYKTTTNGYDKEWYYYDYGKIMDDFINAIKPFELKTRDMIEYMKTVKPSKLIFNERSGTTIVYFDNVYPKKKVVVKCSQGDEFDRAIGFAMAYMKYMFGSRSAYMKFIEKNEHDLEFSYAVGYLVFKVFNGWTDLYNWIEENAIIQSDEEK